MARGLVWVLVYSCIYFFRVHVNEQSPAGVALLQYAATTTVVDITQERRMGRSHENLKSRSFSILIKDATFSQPSTCIVDAWLAHGLLGFDKKSDFTKNITFSAVTQVL